MIISILFSIVFSTLMMYHNFGLWIFHMVISGLFGAIAHAKIIKEDATSHDFKEALPRLIRAAGWFAVISNTLLLLSGDIWYVGFSVIASIAAWKVLTPAAQGWISSIEMQAKTMHPAVESTP